MLGPFCDTEDLEDPQDFYENALPDFFNPDAGNISVVTKVRNMLQEKEKSQTLNLVI